MKLAQIRQEAIDRHAKLLEVIDANAAVDPILDRMDALGPTHIWFDGDSLMLVLSGDKATLIQAIRALRTSGYDTSPDEQGPQAGQAAYRVWFHKEGSIDIWFSFSSTQCKRVKVGTRMVEEGVYETVCD
jgi:hypothetical protein